MDLEANDSEARFSAYVEGLVGVIGHADRAVPLRDYCVGLLMPGERKSVEPLAAVTAPGRVAAQHQSLLHFVGNAPWSDARVLAKVRDLVLPAIERSGPIEAWIIDDTSFPKKGRHSVGVARQYCGQLGKQENCQVAVTLSIANHAASLPVAYRLYLPEAWAADPVRRRKAGVPEDVGFATKPEIALEQIRAAVAAGIPRGTVLMDAGYGGPARAAHGDHRARARLHRGHPAEHHRLAGGRSVQPEPARGGPGQGARPRPARGGLGDRHLARGLGRLAQLALCARAGADRARGSRRAGAGGMAAGGMARGRGGADRVLALQPARGHAPRTRWSIAPSCAGASSATTRS